jgi:hypothetical protein
MNKKFVYQVGNNKKVFQFYYFIIINIDLRPGQDKESSVFV